MKRCGWVLVLACLVVVVSAVSLTAQEDSMQASGFVVVPHMNGHLALRVSQISGLWFQAAADGQAAKLRILSPALSEAKTLGGADAEARWAEFHDGELASLFLFVPHMGGTLGIPRAQIRTAFYSEEGGPRLRLMYEGDPSGKTIDGDDATRIWNGLR